METTETSVPLPADAATTTAQNAEWEARTREYDRKWGRYRERRSAAFPITRAAIFHALNAAGVTRVAIEFEGSGDSGQMEQTTAFSGEEEIVPFPKACIEITRVDFDEESLAAPPMMLSMCHRLARARQCAAGAGCPRSFLCR